MRSDATSGERRRAWMLDLLRALACVLIVWHHLAFYGPMSDAALVLSPGLMDWLFEHGRVAVQVFLVCSGYLTAQALSRTPSLSAGSVLGLLARRYLRLVLPMLAAMSVVVVLSELVRPFFDHPSLSAPPTWGQALAHLLLVHDWLDYEAFSAGLWYVAIDLQLFALAVGSAWLGGRWRWGLWTMLCLLSLWRWNLNADLDEYGLYFFGAYGLGLLAWRVRHLPHAGRVHWGWLALLVLGALALWLEWRWRVAVAWTVALTLAGAPATWMGEAAGKPLPAARPIAWMAENSYAIFLIHFPVSLLVSALVSQVAAEAPWPNAMGMMGSFALSLWAGHALHVALEGAAPTWRRWALWALVLGLSVGVAQGLHAGLMPAAQLD